MTSCQIIMFGHVAHMKQEASGIISCATDGDLPRGANVFDPERPPP